MTADIPAEAVTAAARAQCGQWYDDLDDTAREQVHAEMRVTLAAALPVLNTARPRLASGDVPITERTPHGVWIADGPDPDRFSPACGGLFDCDDCRAYSDLRQHLVEQIIALDEQHQREIKALSASRDSETAEAIAREFERFADTWGSPIPSPSSYVAQALRDRAAEIRAASLRGEQ